MSGADRERTRWFLRNILPHEPALRGWLSRSAPPSVDPGDVIQEAYTILAELESVEAIRHPRAYLFQVARSVIMRHVRRARIVPIHTVDDLERLELPDGAASPEQHAIDRDAASTACPSAKSPSGCAFRKIQSRRIFLAAFYS